jgi:hypothetical protein
LKESECAPFKPPQTSRSGICNAKQGMTEEDAAILSHSRLFYGMPSASLTDLITHARIEWIFGERILPGDELRVVLEGDLIEMSDGRVLGRGNFLGETALMDFAIPDEIRVQSHGGCRCLVVTRPVINAWMERHTPMIARLYQHLSQELFNREVWRKLGRAA